MAMPKSTPRRPGKPGHNRDARDGVFGHPESQVGPLPRVGLDARVSTPHQHTIGMQLRQLREFLERRRWQKVLVVEEVVSESRRRPERDRLLDAARRREIDIIPSGNLPISGPAGSLRVTFHTVAAHAPSSPYALVRRARKALFENMTLWQFWSGGAQNPSARWGLKLGVRLSAKTLVATKVSRGRYDGFGTFF